LPNSFGEFGNLGNSSQDVVVTALSTTVMKVLEALGVNKRVWALLRDYTHIAPRPRPTIKQKNLKSDTCAQNLKTCFQLFYFTKVTISLQEIIWYINNYSMR
jgi:hypothetical protein